MPIDELRLNKLICLVHLVPQRFNFMLQHAIFTLDDQQLMLKLAAAIPLI